MKNKILSTFNFRLLTYLFFVFLFIQKFSYAQYTDNYAANFNGTNSYVSTRSSTDLIPTTAVTVEAWIFPTTLPATSACIIGKNYLTSYYFGIENSGRFIFFPKGSGFFLRSKVSGIVRINQWTHIAATYDGTTTRLYLNGGLDTSTTSITGAVGSNTDSLYIGCDRLGGAPAFFFNGRLDNVRIWKSARTSAEISSHRFIPLEIPGLLNVPYSTIAASYQFDNDAVDNSGGLQEFGNERNITYTNYSNKAINYLDYNNSLLLNGTTDYARRGNYNSVYDPTTNITLEAWIKRDTTGTQPFVQNLINKSGGLDRVNYAFLVYSTGELHFSINSGTNTVQSAAVVTNAQWTHVAVTYSKATGRAIIYKNGDTVANATFGTLPAIASDADSTFIGGIGATAYAANKFKGQIDEVRIWFKAARSQSQIKEFMHKHYKASTSDSLMHIDFDRFQNSFKLGNAYFLGSLLLRGNATINSAHDLSFNRLSSPMLSDPAGELFSSSFYTSSFRRFFIPDANAAGASDSVFISGGPPVNNLKIYLLMSHTYTQDLILTLTSPSGTTINLLTNKGGNGNDIMTIFSDGADSIAASGFSTLNGPGISSPFSPVIKPDQQLSTFNGQSRAGWWELKCIDQAGADIGYVNAWGLNLLSQKTLNVTALLQGFYNASTDKLKSDTARMYFRIPLPPYPIVDSSKAVLDSNGNANFYFTKVNNGYRVIKHRNSIETWSSSPIPFIGDSSSYNFSASASNAYGNNQIQVDFSPLRYAIYGGDVNQDGLVDLTDNQLIDNDASNFVTGYGITDITGDNIVDLNDAALADNNASKFVSKITP